MNNHDPDASTVQVLPPQARQSRPPAPPRPESGGPNLHEILSILFKHKWKILVLGLIGLGSGLALYLKRTPMYYSEAKIFVPYVLETGMGDNLQSKITPTSGRDGGAILNVEVNLLTSWDLAETVAAEVTPAVILPEAGKNASINAAAGTILANLLVVVPKNSLVLNVGYMHPDPEKARAILTAVVNAYLVKHQKTHRSGVSFADVDGKRTRAKQAADGFRKQLEELKKNQNIISVTSRESALVSQQGSIEAELLAAESKRAEQRVRLEAALANAPEAPKTPAKTNDSPEAAPAPSAMPGPKQGEELQSLTQQLSSLRQRVNELGLRYRESNPMITTIQEQIARIQTKRDELLAAYPGLMVAARQPDGQPGASGPLPVDPKIEREILAQMDARVSFLQAQRDKLNTELSSLLTSGSAIAQLEKDIEENDANFRYFNTALERAKVDQLLKPTELENVTLIQQPSVAAAAPPGMESKIALGLAIGGFVLGIALALLIELVLDRSIRRPHEFESKVHVPLMLAIPYLKQKRQLTGGASQAVPGQSLLPGPDGSKPIDRRDAGPTPWRPAHFIRPFADAIRDRIGYHFHIHGVTHKPKMIGLTGFSGGAGTSTLAASLASSFAEMTDGKVLYINLNGGVPLPADGGDEKLLRRDEEMPERAKESIRLVDRLDNLSVATISTMKHRAGSGEDATPKSLRHAPAPFIPKELYDLIPRLRASDYEYVIFDMPALSATSPTLALSRYMDKVLLVVDAGKTPRNVVSRAYHELTAKANADVSTILNKTDKNIPAWLQG